jgi:hypothetical protein
VIGHNILLFIGSWYLYAHWRSIHIWVSWKRNRAANSFYNKMWFINLFFWGEAKLVWTEAEVVRPDRKSTQFLCCRKCQRVCYFWGGLTHYWLSWNPLLCMATKLKVGHGVALLLPLSVVGQISLHSFWRTCKHQNFIKTCCIRKGGIYLHDC